MSEYQFYEFRTIDRPFSAAEKAEIKTWSSRAEVDNHKAQFVYHYGDFRQNAENVMFQYFDAMLYYANFGTKKIIFRFPLALVNKKDLVPYTFSENIEIRTKGDYFLLIIEENVENGGFEDWFEADNSTLSDLMGVRQQIINGDYRALYLAWLYFHSPNSQATFPADYYDNDEEDEENAKMTAIEPPLPPNLQHLGSDLQHFVDFWGLSEDWVKAAAIGSKAANTDAENLSDLVARLSEKEKNDFLLRLANQEPNLAAVFLKKLRSFLPQKGEKNDDGRKVQEIAELAEEIRKGRLQQEQAESKKKALQKIEQTQKNKAKIWDETIKVLGLQTAKGYDEAATNIEKLYAAAKYFQEVAVFETQLQAVIAPYKRSKAFMKRVGHLPFIS